MKILTIVLSVFTISLSIFANSEKENHSTPEINSKNNNPPVSTSHPGDASVYTKNYTLPFTPSIAGPYGSSKQIMYPKGMSFIPPVYQQMATKKFFPYGQYPSTYMVEQEPKKRNNLFWFINGLMVMTPLIGLGIGYWRKEFFSDIKEEPIVLILGLSFSGILGLVQAAINSVSYL